MATFDEFFATLDLDEEGNVKKNKTEKGLPFEQIFIKWFLKNDPVWSSIIDEFLETNKKDLGIDLIFKDKDGNKWAVQSKGYSPKTYITKESIDSFISASPTSKFYKRLLIASTDRIGANADITLKENKVVRFLLKDFRNSTIDFPPTVKELSKAKKIKPFLRRQHQKKAINDVLKKIESVERGQVLMACGTGKTLTSLWIKEDLKAKQVLVLVPSLNLLSQTLTSWRRNLSKPFKWQCICSDKTVHKEKDSEENWINDPLELGIPVTSNIQEIKKFLLTKEHKVLFSTYQSSELIVEAQKDKQIPTFDIIFADEAHKCAGKISEDFSYVLDNEKIRANKRLFFTATPKVLSTQIRTQAFKTETELASMDDKNLFGDVLHILKFSDAINQGILTDYQVIVIGIDNELISKKIKNRDFIKTSEGKIIDSESLALQIALVKGIKQYDLHRIINFHSRIQGAKFYKDTLEKTINEIPLNERPSGEISCDYVEGKMKTEDRIAKIENLRKISHDDRKILGNARCLSEGVDVPSLDGITFVDPKSSEVDIVQAVGRVIRKGNKQKGTILIPIYLENLENIEDQILESRFSGVWRVIQALKLHDDVLKENIDNLRISLGQRKSKREDFKGLQKIHFDLPVERINQQFIQSIETFLVQNTSAKWFEKYGELVRFLEENNNKYPLQKHPSLGKWIQVQRRNYASGTLIKERFDLLNEINFIWNTNVSAWKKKYLELEKFYSENNHSSPLFIHKTLGHWVGKQRQNFKDGKLTGEQIKLLNNLKFNWDPLETEWQNNFIALKEFKKENGHANPSKNPTLRVWCTRQRICYKKGLLTKEKIEFLNGLKFYWDPLEDVWNEKYIILKEFYINNGHSQVHQKTHPLGKWVDRQRHNYKKGILTKEKIQLLNEIQFSWNTLDKAWNEQFLELKKFQENQNHLSPSRKRYPSLCSWIGKNRDNYKKGILSKERIDLLEKIGFSWDPYDDDWQKQYLELKEFKLVHGHCDASSNTNLGKWTGRNRIIYKKGILSRERIDLLEKIGFSWDPLIDKWQKQYLELKKFKIKEGHCSPKASHPSLGRWVGKNRTNYKKGILSRERIDLLEKIGFSWDPLEDEWQKQYLELKKFKQNNNNLNPSKDLYPTLANWIVKNRNNYKRGGLNKQKIKLLHEIGFDWIIN